ncbi:MAG: ParB N-terminal domain-containing protein [Deltaproteobacteria bacterium]|nr:ParB N-terminal domain-containing protein [Deltaproteobacteria bacterium]
MGKKDFSGVAAQQIQRDQATAKAQPNRFETAIAALGAAPMAESKAVMPIESITERAKNIREVDPRQGIERALTIAEHGLLQNLVVDSGGRLIAGAHRRWALLLLREVSGDAAYARKKLLEHFPEAPDAKPEQAKIAARWLTAAATTLAAGWEKHSFARGIEVKRLAFSADANPALAVVAEIVENTGRSSFSTADVSSAWARLSEVGFVDVKNRPKPGELPIWPAMEQLFGAHRKTLKKLLEEPVRPPPAPALPALESSVKDALSRAFALPVAVKTKVEGRGTFIISYDSPKALQRILDAVARAPDAAG